MCDRHTYDLHGLKDILEMWKTNRNENATEFDLELSVIKYYDITNKVKSTKSFHHPG